MSVQTGGKGNFLVGLSGLIGFAFLVVSLFLFLPNASNMLYPLVLLAVIAVALELWSQPLTAYGYVSLASFIYFLAVARPQSAPMAALVLASQGLIVAAPALILRVGVGSFQSGLQRLAYLSLNLLRVGVVSFAFGIARGDAAIVSLRSLGAALLAMALYAGLDALLTGAVVETVEGESEAKVYRAGSKDSGYLPLVGIPVGLLAAAFAQAAAGTLPPMVDLACASLLGASLMAAVRFALKKSFEEIVVQDQEKLEQDLKREQFRVRTLTDENRALVQDLDSKKDENNLVYELANELGASTDLAGTLAVVQTFIKRLHIPYQSCVIFLVKADGKETLVPAKTDTPYENVLQMSSLLQLEETLIKKAMQTRKPQSEFELGASAEQRIFKDERSAIAVPLVVSKETVGVVYVGSIKPGTHNTDHVNKLKMLAAYAAPSLKTALLFEDKEKEVANEKGRREAEEAKNRQLSGIQKMGQEITRSSLKIDHTMKVVAEGLQEMIPRAQSVIVFTNGKDDTQQLKAEYASSPYAQYVETLPVRKDEGLFKMAFDKKDTMLMTDTQMYQITNIINYERSVILAPLVTESDLMGCIYVGAKDENTFTEEHKNLVQTVSYQAAMAIKNARLFNQIEMQSLTDGLTGLYTHRYFQTRLQDEIDWAERHNRHMCLVMVDTDHFKSYNDTLGHPAGDSLLKEIAALLKEKVRTTDIVCRYGGDEFALILKETSKEDAMRTCERVREAFQLRFSSHKVRITSSIGMACFPSDAHNKKELAEAADEALYVSKRGGRNRVNASPTLEERAKREKIVQETLPRS
ncbi:MAG: hypothetical protein AMXMBFR33_19830 [Candidatus Xenobia bacterium]